MSTSGKAIAAIIVVVLLAGALVFSQFNASKPKSIKLSADQMSLLVKELLPPPQQQQLASDPEKRKEFAKNIKQLLALGQAAESEGLAQTEEVKSQVDLQTNLALRDAYEKKNPGAPPTEQEVTAYYQSHPNEWDSFLNANPQFKQQASGPQGEAIKKEFGQIKLQAERARNEGLDKEETTKLRVLLGRSQALARAYVSNLQKNMDKLVTDADVEKYYNEHKDEFEEVRASHILISTDAGGGGDENDEKDKKPLSKEEARKKAESILERVRKGEDFAKLATENSDDPGSKTKGGDLDFFAKGAMVKPFDDVAFALKPGEVSDIVETEFGYHIIKVAERKAADISDPQTRQKITQKLQQKKFEEEIERIANSGGVEVAEDFTVTPEPSAQPQMPIPGAVPGGNPHQ